MLYDLSTLDLFLFFLFITPLACACIVAFFVVIGK